MAYESRLSDLTTGALTGISSHARQPLALVFSDDLSAELGDLTSRRCQAALPFAGKYRLIDFALSSCVNSGIETIGVITQYQPRSLQAHLAYGRPWDLDRREGGLTLLHPYQARTGMGWYAGTADALYQNQEFIFRHHTDDVLVLAGSQAYSVDLDALAAQHHTARADLTIVAAAGERQRADRDSTLEVDSEGWVRALVSPGSGAPGPLVATGILLFSTDVLSWRLSEDAHRPGSSHDLIRDVVSSMIHLGDRVMAIVHAGYWNGLRTVQDYWQANMDLLDQMPELNLQDSAWPIRTQAEIRPPTRLSAGARVSHSLLSDGCVVDGTVEYSILSPGAYVGLGAVASHSVIMHDTTIEERAVVENAILDADVIVGPHAHVGRITRHAPTSAAARSAQITVVGQGTHIPAHQTIAPQEHKPAPPSEDWVVRQRRQPADSQANAT